MITMYTILEEEKEKQTNKKGLKELEFPGFEV